MTQRALADRLGVKESTISNWVRGEREPKDVETLVRIATALRSSVDWLLAVPRAEEPADVQGAIEERVRRAREELRAEILAALERWDGGRSRS